MSDVEALQDQLEEVIRAAENYSAKLEEQNDVIQELRDRNRQLEDELMNGEGGSQFEMKEELRSLRELLEQAEDDREKEMDARREEQLKVQDLDLQLKSFRMDKLKLEVDFQNSQSKVDELEEELHLLRQRTEKATESEGRLGAMEKSRKQSLIKALAENEELRKEVTDLESDVQTLFQAVNEKEASIKTLVEELKHTKEELSDAEQELQDTKQALSDKNAELASAHEEIHAVGELEMEIEEKVKVKIDKWKQKLQLAEGELQKEKQARAELQNKYNKLMSESGVREIENQMVATEEKYQAASKELTEMQVAFQKLENELRTMARENDSLRSDQSKFVQVALENEARERERLKHIIAGKDALLEEERQRYRELFDEKGSLEEELVDREKAMEEYERGHGLTEAVSRQKKLKADIKRRDKEIMRINEQLNMRMTAHEKLYETCRRLKKKAGLAEDFEFPNLELEEGMRGQTEQLKGLIHELESQNNALEDERLRLLESLRKNAQIIGEKGMKHYGLNAEQVVMVNEFIENLRDGRVNLPLNDISMQLKQEVRDLKTQLADAKRDIARMEMYGGHAGSSLGETDAQAVLERMLHEQANMKAELADELRAMVTTMSHIQDTKNKGQAKDPQYEEMLKVLQAKLTDKLEKPKGSETSNQAVEWMKSELERITGLNESLMKRVSDSEARVQFLESTSGGGSRFPNDPFDMSLTQTYDFAKSGSKTDDFVLSRAGKHFQEQVLGALRLPPEEWAEQYALLNAKLVLCIERLSSKDKQVDVLEKSLKQYEQKLSIAGTQLSLLYRDYLEKKNDWKTQTQLLTKEADEARSERDALRSKARRLDTLCAVLEGEDEDCRKHAKDLSRKIAQLEFNEVVLARRYNLLSEQEKLLRNEKDMIQHEMIQSDTALKERVLYLEEWKAGAQYQLEAMDRRLANLVSRESYDMLVTKHSALKHKHRDLLSRETKLRGRTTGAQAALRRARDMEHDLELLQVEYAEARALAETNKVTISEELEHADEARQIEELAKFKGIALEKDIRLESTTKRNEILEARLKKLEAEIKVENSRLQESDAALEASRNVVDKLESEIANLQDRFLGGATRQEKQVLNDRITELENIFESQSLELRRAKELTEIANGQVQAYASSVSAKQTELRELQQQLLDVNSRSDDDAIIGKVQYELVNTKVSYQMFVRKFEMAKVSMRRHELENRKLELELDEVNRTLQETRDHDRARIRVLESALSQLGVENPEEPSKNEFNLRTMERLSETIANLGLAAEQSEDALRRSEVTRRNLEVELASRNLEVESMKNTMLAINSSKPLTDRFVEISEECKNLKLDNLRSGREIQVLREEIHYLENLRAKDDDHMRRLEESVVLAENLIRKREDEIRIRAAIPPRRGRKDDAMVATSSATDANATAHSATNFDKPVEYSENRELISELERQIREADEREERNQRQLESQNSQIMYLRKRLEAEGIGESTELMPHASKVNEPYQLENRKLQAAAQQTIACLKDIVNKKNDVIEGLKDKLRVAQKTAIAEKERDQAEIERLTEKLYDDNQNAITKLRSAYEDISTGVVPHGVDENASRELLERLDEADMMLDRKDRRILELESVIEELQILRQKAEDRASQSVEIAEKLREKLRLSNNSAGTTQESNSSLVQSLRAQIVAKDKKMAGLRSAVVALKTEFVKSEEEHEEELIRKDSQINALSGGAPKLASTQGASSDQLQGLIDRVERTRKELESAKRVESKLRSDNKALRRQLREASEGIENDEDTLNRSTADASLYQKQIDDLRRENVRLKDTMRKTRTMKKEEKQDDPDRGQEAIQLQKRVEVLEAQNAALRSAMSKSDDTLDNNKKPESQNAMAQVYNLKRKLQEKSRELEAVKVQLETTKQLADKKKFASTSSAPPAPPVSKPVADAGSQPSRLEMQNLQQENQRLRRIVDVEHKIEAKQLQHELDATRIRCAELEEDMQGLRSRQRGTTVQEQYAREDELREQLQRLRNANATLETELLDRENALIELRFQLEFSEVPASSGMGSERTSRPSALGDRSKRERELEDVIDAMKKVVAKLRSENERLSRSESSNAKYNEVTKKVKALRAENTELQTANEGLNRRLQNATSSSAKLVRLEDNVKSLRSQLKEKDDMLAREKARAATLMDENRVMLEELEQSNLRNEALPSGATRAGRVIAHAQQAMSRETQEELYRLREENKRLLSELNAFDVDFFEEIEDLKFRYQQALEENKKLKQMGRS